MYKYIYSLIGLCLLLSTPHQGWTQTKDDETPGIIDSLEELISGHRDQYSKVTQVITKNPKLLEDLSAETDLRIDPYFMRSILLHSDQKYLALLDGTPCSFFALLENDLLRTTEGKIKNVLVRIVDEKKNITESASISIEDFLKKTYKDKCFKNKEISALFQLGNLSKTFQTIEFNSPASHRQCLKSFKLWKKNQYLPYICGIAEKALVGTRSREILATNPEASLARRRNLRQKIRDADQIAGLIPNFELNYIKNLCLNLDSEENFCASYLAEDVWTRVINGEVDASYMTPICYDVTGKKPKDQKDLKQCRERLLAEKTKCEYKNADIFPALFPRPDCQQISESLNHAHLKTFYRDCPGRVDNDLTTLAHRLIHHFKPKKIKSDQINCATEAHFTHAELFREHKREDEWPFKICYYDRIEAKEICYNYVPGNSPGIDMSENQIITKILKRMGKLDSNLTCKVVSDSQYRPVFLEYKTGCYIIFDLAACKSTHCPKKIVINTQEQEGITYKGFPLYAYMPDSLVNTDMTLDTMLTESAKLDSKNIKNLTELKFFFKQFPNGVIHGMGCIEDILPYFFKRNSFNECHQSTFIIDGYEDDGSNTYLVARLSIDQIQYPRKINWQFVFNAITNYRNYHPLNTWTLYGIK